MRKVRGVKKVSQYLESINCPMSESTIHRSMREGGIPYKKPTPRIVIFDLDEIDTWLEET
ncbi:AlpA family phage regulatory protein [Salibacterium salarium]|uniref:AlpA family phage regulatory protein n=1 Tax=Salibacterium salarium TaxID=284579 RepID=A0A3R9PK97_9BACI|nr:AlpA family phage regulatory protein [Salibacterium salarium]RSL32637.1 AlpA family phage regulatory protein [Salibacterium salarium]